jgi:vancomycin resistance protein YoaR
MSTHSNAETSMAHPPARSAAPVGQAIVALTTGLALFILLTGLLPAVYGKVYSGMIFPGVSVSGVDLSGLTTQQASALLSQRLDYPQRGQIVFQEGKSLWTATPAEVGLYLDSQTSAAAAYNIGRNGSYLTQAADRWGAWSTGVNLSPLFVYDERIAQTYLQSLAAQVDRPIIEATLGVSGVEVVVNSGQVGRTLDVPVALQTLATQLKTLSDGIVPLVVAETPPIILDVTEQANLARQILSASLELRIPNPVDGDPGPWSFDPATLAGILTIERLQTPEGEQYQVGLSSVALRNFLESIAPLMVVYPQNARFIFNDDTRQLDLIESAVIGRAMDIDNSIIAINQLIAAGQHTIDLNMQTTNPPVTNDSTAESLGITELVSVETSYFRGSSAERIQNITLASAQFHGVMVAPGESFSMASMLGDVSLDNGYAEALIIFGDRTIRGVGGGVCQVSTTLFRTAFFGGFPIDERYAHAYRVGYYEQSSGGTNPDYAGLDATVFAPVVDFRFTNDTPNWLLMETYINGASLTWKFYSTSDGRSVEWDTTGLQNVTDPPDPLYEENPDLAQGTLRQVDWAVDGADVTITRTVYRDGGVLHSDVFATHYLPWREVWQYGPGTEIPTPEPPNP